MSVLVPTYLDDTKWKQDVAWCEKFLPRTGEHTMLTELCGHTLVHHDYKLDPVIEDGEYKGLYINPLDDGPSTLFVKGDDVFDGVSLSLSTAFAQRLYVGNWDQVVWDTKTLIHRIGKLYFHIKTMFHVCLLAVGTQKYIVEQMSDYEFSKKYNNVDIRS